MNFYEVLTGNYITSGERFEDQIVSKLHEQEYILLFLEKIQQWERRTGVQTNIGFKELYKNFKKYSIISREIRQSGQGPIDNKVFGNIYFKSRLHIIVVKDAQAKLG